MGTRTCDATSDGASATAAEQQGYRRDFAPIKVAIDSVDAGGQVHFFAKGSITEYVTSWKAGSIWPDCPTTLDGPTVGSEGILYVGKALWAGLDASAKLYSPGLKWPEELSARWRQRDAAAPEQPGVVAQPATATPDTPQIAAAKRRAAEQRATERAFDTLGFSRSASSKLQDLPLSSSYQALTLSVDSVQITARVPGRADLIEFELFGPEAPLQVLDLFSFYSTLQVRDAAGQFAAVRMQILHAVLHGTDPRTTISAKLDLLDPTLADAFQVVDFTTGSAAAVGLSQKGFALFGRGFRPTAVTAPSNDNSNDNDVWRHAKVVTFLAAPANGVSAIPPDGDNAIEQIGQVIEPYLAVRRVSSVLEILLHLSQLEFIPETIQIIGHGTPGMLSLGYYWDPSKYTDDDGGPFYVLDSNPYAYGILQPFVNKPTRVVLAGCNLTSDEPSPMIANGRALVSDLHAMWGCDVLAADDLVGPDNFCDGLFVGSMRGFVGEEWRREPAQPTATAPGATAALAATIAGMGGVAPPEPTSPYRTSPPKFTDVVISAAPALGRISDVFLERPGSIRSALLDRYSVEVSLRSILAMNEVSLRAKVGDQEVQLHLLCNARFLKVVFHAGSPEMTVHYFAARNEPSDGTVQHEFAPGRTTPAVPRPSVPLHIRQVLRENQLRRLASVPSDAETKTETKPPPSTSPAGPPAVAARPLPMTNGQSSSNQPMP